MTGRPGFVPWQKQKRHVPDVLPPVTWAERGGEEISLPRSELDPQLSSLCSRVTVWEPYCIDTTPSKGLKLLCFVGSFYALHRKNTCNYFASRNVVLDRFNFL